MGAEAAEGAAIISASAAFIGSSTAADACGADAVFALDGASDFEFRISVKLGRGVAAGAAVATATGAAVPVAVLAATGAEAALAATAGAEAALAATGAAVPVAALAATAGAEAATAGAEAEAALAATAGAEAATAGAEAATAGAEAAGAETAGAEAAGAEGTGIGGKLVTAEDGPKANEARFRFPVIGGKLFKFAGPRFPKFIIEVLLTSSSYSFSDYVTGSYLRRARFARKACSPFIEKHDEHASRLKHGAYDWPPCARADDA